MHESWKIARHHFYTFTPERTAVFFAGGAGLHVCVLHYCISLLQPVMMVMMAGVFTFITETCASTPRGCGRHTGDTT